MNPLEDIFKGIVGPIANKLVVGLVIGLIIASASAYVILNTSKFDLRWKERRNQMEQADKVAQWIIDQPTESNLKKFREDYPDHPFAATAIEWLDSIELKKIEDELWWSIQNNPNEFQIIEFLENFKQSPRIAQAKHLLQKLRYENLDKNLSAISLEEYLNNYPDASERNKLCTKLDSLYWQQARAENTEYFVSRYLLSFSETCGCKNKRQAIQKLQDFENNSFDPKNLAGKTFKGHISRDDEMQTLIVQFFETNDAEKVEASFNIGRDRFTDLIVDVEGNQFFVEEVNGSQKIRYMQGYYYAHLENPFIETAYFPNNLYWRAELYQ